MTNLDFPKSSKLSSMLIELENKKEISPNSFYRDKRNVKEYIQFLTCVKEDYYQYSRMYNEYCLDKTNFHKTRKLLDSAYKILMYNDSTYKSSEFTVKDALKAARKISEEITIEIKHKIKYLEKVNSKLDSLKINF